MEMFWEAFGIWALWSTALWDTIFAGILAYSIFNNRIPFDSKWIKWTMVTACMGLLGQAFRSMYGIVTGMAPTDAEMPFWIFKDYSEGMFILFFIWVTLQGKKVIIK